MLQWLLSQRRVKFITSKISRRGSEIPQSSAITASVYALVQLPTDAILLAYKRTRTPHAGAWLQQQSFAADDNGNIGPPEFRYVNDIVRIPRWTIRPAKAWLLPMRVGFVVALRDVLSIEKSIVGRWRRNHRCSSKRSLLGSIVFNAMLCCMLEFELTRICENIPNI